MNIAGWIIFLLAAVGTVAVWQYNSFERAELERTYTSQIKDIDYQLEQRRKKADSTTDKLAAAIEKYKAELAEQEDELTSLKKRQSELGATIKQGEEKKFQIEGDLYRLPSMWDEMRGK